MPRPVARTRRTSPASPLRTASGDAVTVVHLTAEYTPYARTGGLAEAVQGLATFQTKQGIPVVVIVPLYRVVRSVATNLVQIGDTITVHVGPRREQVRFFRDADVHSGPTVIFVDHPGYFDRAGIYVESGADYPDNPRRFGLFTRAALEVIPMVVKGPVLVHAHDWHSALALVYMRTYGDLRQRFHGTPAVLSVHNAGYQGHFPPAVIGDLGIPPETFNYHQLEWYGKVNLLKGGLAFCDFAVTVSPSHADELRTPAGGFGLHAMFTSMGDRFQGITNGIDQNAWNPATDTQITANFTRQDTSSKAKCKAALQRIFGLPQRPRVPIFGMCGRLVKQKGFDIILASGALNVLDAQFVFLGQGDERYKAGLRNIAARRPQHVSSEFVFTDKVEHLLIAGSDLLLMPSEYEPCGLTQMRAQRYGALVIGRRVGGITDTVHDDATGFLFDAFTPGAFDQAIGRALHRYYDHQSWEPRMYEAMGRDFGWASSASRYLQLYRRALAAANPES
ncbi:MAG: glycogen/starch synthase [Gemmatimonadaceae bacterium]